MASNNPNPHNPSVLQSIPLQDLARPPDSGDIADESQRSSRSSGSRAGLIANRHSLLGRGAHGRRYERIAESSPSPTDRLGLNPAHPASLTAGPSNSPYMDDLEPPSPIGDLGGFQAAMTSVGLSFDSPPPALPMSTPPAIVRTRSGLVTDDESISSFSRPERIESNDSETYFSPTETDTTPLTDRQHLQPISGASGSTPRGQRHDRQSLQSVHFEDGTSPGSRLGDDLPNLETGLSRKQSASESGIQRMPSYESRARSLSPSVSQSPLSRAGSIVRMMSQRVVNLSHEPDVVESTIRRKSSLKHARLEGPPSFPAMPEYAHDETNDEPTKPPRPIEKAPPIVQDGQFPRQRWQHSNPLKGNSLGIFPPENKIRKKLCELLVHPVTEPAILVLIVIQTVLLAVDSAPSVYNDPRSRHWGTSKIDYALFVLFVIYTLEIIVRMIVSGFIFNADEYSTLDHNLTLRQALMAKSRSFFTPQRSLSTKKTAIAAEPQPSIFRTFTGLQEQPDVLGSSRQQQRVRLARRAYLRHSFNRVDFVAVVSFWTSFALTLANVESHRHVYVFRMLSCLRILRLLNLTSGTSVSLTC